MSTNFGVTQFLLLSNLIVMSFSAWAIYKSAYTSIESLARNEDASFTPEINEDDVTPPSNDHQQRIIDTTAGTGSTDSNGLYFVTPKEGERNFYEIGKRFGTDKVTAPDRLPGCLQNDKLCTRPNCTRPECRPWGHHYDTIYQQRMGPFSRDDVEPFQFLEVGFYEGGGYDTVSVSHMD